MAGVLLGGHSAAVSGHEALRLAGVTRAGRGIDARLPVLVLTREHRSRRLGPLLIRRTERPYGAVCTPWDADLPLTPVVEPARAVADVALQLPNLDLVRAVVAAAVQQNRCVVEELVAELTAGPRQGSAWFRRALAEVSDGARSAAEAWALAGLRRGRVPAFELNVPIHDATGRHVFTVDVLWRHLRAALEIDSRDYHFDRGDWLRTLERHAALTSAGLSVLHLPPARITSDAGWIDEVRRWLRTRAGELGVPLSAPAGVATGAGPPLVLPGL